MVPELGLNTRCTGQSEVGLRNEPQGKRVVGDNGDNGAGEETAATMGGACNAGEIIGPGLARGTAVPGGHVGFNPARIHAEPSSLCATRPHQGNCALPRGIDYIVL
jgi:hypothetical protein